MPILEHPDTVPVSPDAANDEFTGAALDTAGTRHAGAVPWVWGNQTGATASVGYGALEMVVPAKATPSHSVVSQAIAGNTGLWRYEAKISMIGGFLQQYTACGLYLMNGATAPSALQIWGFSGDNSVRIDRYTYGGLTVVAGSVDATLTIDDGVTYAHGPYYFAIEQTASNLLYQLSLDGSRYVTLRTRGKTADLTATHIGIGGFSNNTSGNTRTLTNFFRRVPVRG